jgi:hypothetical protein
VYDEAINGVDAMTIRIDGRDVSWEECLALAPNATDVTLENLAGVTALPEFPNAKDVWLRDFPRVTTVPEFANAKRVTLMDSQQIQDSILRKTRRLSAKKANEGEK